MMTRLSESKYGNKKVQEDNYTFDSQAEHKRYRELKLLEKAGEITGLRVHPRFDLHSADVNCERVKVGTYAPDFWYIRMEYGPVFEDVKSPPTRTSLYNLKKKMFEVEYGVPITEIEA